MGQATLAAVAEYGDTVHLIDAVCARRMAFLKALRTFPRFGRGWTRRVDGVRAAATAWAKGHGHQMPLDVPVTKKARPSDAKKPPGKGAADATTGGGLVTGGLGTALETARQHLEPLTDALPIVGYIVIGLVVGGVLLTVGGMAYRWYAACEAAKIADALDLPQGVAA